MQTKTVSFCFISLLFVTGSLFSQEGKSNFSGTWKFNKEKSELNPPTFTQMDPGGIGGGSGMGGGMGGDEYGCSWNGWARDGRAWNGRTRDGRTRDGRTWDGRTWNGRAWGGWPQEGRESRNDGSF
jgi:hypothetical protein